MKYIIELEKIEGTNLYKAKGANTLVFDENGIRNILTPYKEKEEKIVDWSKVPVETKVFVSNDGSSWRRRYFAKYEDGLFYSFVDGKTLWSSEDNITCWKYAKLAEDENEKED